MSQPRIGITVDAEGAGGYSRFPWFALRQNYCSAVIRAGGLPLLLPHEPSLIDVDPALFGACDRHPKVTIKEGRTAFELALTRLALASDMPMLGICGGQQLLHVALGGTLIQHIPDEIQGAIAHEQPNPRDEPGHSVRIVPGTRLHDIVGVDELAVNSAHHQAAKDAPEGVAINAVAPDGVIEGIEAAAFRFCLGVQWHPEFELSAGDKALFHAFVAACNGGS
jgi:putative glutamine amidotransferase